VADIDAFYLQLNTITAGITDDISVRELWARIAVLNSTLADGHLKVGHASTSQWRKWVSGGMGLFPFEVAIVNQQLYIKSNTGGTKSDYAEQQIKAINGMPYEQVMAQLLRRTHGDTDEFRQEVLARQFHRLFYLTFGYSEQFSITLADEDLTLTASKSMPQSMVERSFADTFHVEYAGESATLTVNSFSWPDFKQYLTFMDATFTQLKEKNIKHLVIDISNNGGGDDDFWMAGIMRYITDVPYRHFSHYRSKVLLKYRDPGQIVGEIESGENTRFIQPEPELANFFTGDVAVKIGAYTYSSAIVFANTLQDFSIAPLVGENTTGRSTQTGGIQFLNLTHSNLQMVSPRFILTRPNGELQMTGVKVASL
jgi:C-terminal processing protease CtpA/Prc